jgi:hypothetical protein
MVLTRSQTRQLTTADKVTESYQTSRIFHDVNFDESSRAWRKNKEKVGQGTWKYKANAFKDHVLQELNTETIHMTDTADTADTVHEHHDTQPGRSWWWKLIFK